MQRGQFPIECEHCGYFWVQGVFTEADYVYLDGNEEQECPECKGVFDFDEHVGNVTPLVI
jgi:phage FluMu protein Com